MQAIGDSLREARMRQKIDISEVEDKTKIRAKYLRALENEEFDLLPGTTFVRSFLRTYAEYLGLDAHMLVEEYRSRYEPRGQEELTPFSTQSQPRGRDRAGGGPRRPRWGAIAGVAVLALLVFLLALGLANNDNGSKNNNSSTTTQATKQKSKKKTATAEAPPKPRRVVLKVAPAEATYVCVDRGAGTPVSFMGTISAPTQWRGRRLRLNLGKTSATVTVNGKKVDIPPGPSPVGYEFTTKRMKPLPVGSRPCA
jgi:cytoskeleton protein RodZ